MQTLKMLRQQAGLSQEAVARIAQPCSISTVRQAESGAVPSEAMRGRIARALGVEPGSIWPAEDR